MNKLAHRLVMLGVIGLLFAMLATACTLTGANAAPLTPAGPSSAGVTPATQTPIGVLISPTAFQPLDVFGTQTATARAALSPTPLFGFSPTPLPGAVTTTPFAPTLSPLLLTPTATPTLAPGACPATYTVQAGDNLFRIALRFGLTVSELAAANGITNPDVLPVGTVLKIPGCGGAAGTPVSTPGAAAGGGIQPQAGDTVAANGDILHTVKAGENLFRIALAYGLSWQVVADYNGITDPNQIYVGQVIRIPRH